LKVGQIPAINPQIRYCPDVLMLHW